MEMISLGKRKRPKGRFLRLSKKWLAPLFRGFHSSLAPTARPGSYAGKPLLRKAFCGFAVHAAKSDYSLRGGKAERRQWREERGGSPVSKGAPGRPHGPTQRDLCELHCGPRTPGGFSTGWGSPFAGDPIIFPRSCPSSLRPRVQYDLPDGIAPKIPQHHIPFCRAGIHDLARAHIYAHMVYFV